VKETKEDREKEKRKTGVKRSIMPKHNCSRGGVRFCRGSAVQGREVEGTNEESSETKSSEKQKKSKVGAIAREATCIASRSRKFQEDEAQNQQQKRKVA